MESGQVELIQIDTEYWLVHMQIRMEYLKIEIEGYNRSKPDDERNPQASALRGCRQVFSGG